MSKYDSHDFLMEKRLRELDPDLHRRFTDAVVALQFALSRYLCLFPEFTDHSVMHSMTVIDFCNALIGNEQIEKLNADEIYVLLMSCYLHDIGMGISQKDYELFKTQLDHEAYFAAHPSASAGDFVRHQHHELSGLFIRKYAEMLEIPSPEHVFSIVQVSRGHRKTDLYDPSEYPAAFRMPSGNTVCLPYLAALIRLADEIDVTASRNSPLIFSLESLSNERDIYFGRLHEAVPGMTINAGNFLLDVHTSDETIYAGVCDVKTKMQQTLELCRDVVHKRTPYHISQHRIEIHRL